MAKMTTSEMLRRACVHGEQHLESLIESYGKIQPEDTDYNMVQGWKQELRQLRAYRTKRWGETQLEGYLKEATSVNIYELMGRPKEQSFVDPTGGKGMDWPLRRPGEPDSLAPDPYLEGIDRSEGGSIDSQGETENNATEPGGTPKEM